MSEIPGRQSLAPDRKRGVVGSGTPKIASLEHQKKRYAISVETQVCFFVLLPIAVSVVLLAIAGSQR